MKFIYTFDYHQKKPNQSMENHAQSLMDGICRKVEKCTKIYLDTKYWVELRNVILGTETDDSYVNILKLLRLGVNSGKIICPISDINFYEILLQKDPKTLNSSVSLIDSLSKGISLIAGEERVRFELLCYIHYFHNKKQTHQYPHQYGNYVWSKVCNVYGNISPSLGQFQQKISHLPKTEKLVIQKAFLDQMWSLSLKDMIETFGLETISKMPKFSDLSSQLNRDKVKYSYQNSSFKQLFVTEVEGSIDGFRHLINEISKDYLDNRVYEEPYNKIDLIVNPQLLANSILDLFKSNKLSGFLPSFVIEAGLHASVRQDINRKFKPNDLSDFHHARAALPYYDYFFTERSLKDLVSRNNIAFDRKYNCIVEFKPEDVQKRLEKLVR